MNIRYTIGLTVLGLLLSACQSNLSKGKTADVRDAQDTQTQVEENPFAAIEIPDMDRNYVSLTAEIARHELTVIDFWASWCGPCRQEMPNMVALHNQFSSQGLGIIGISLDKDYAAWKSAVAEMHMSWLQLSELRGWEDYTARLFGVRSIPQTFLIN